MSGALSAGLPCVRPATESEFREDLAKREAALESAWAGGIISERQYREGLEINARFKGYPRRIERGSR